MSQHTEVVYVCSPDRTWQLATSLESLFSSGSSFDSVRIYCVGDRPRSWSFSDPRVIVEEVEPLHESYFTINKTYLTESPADRVIFLDTDTVVLKPLDLVWRNTETDFIGKHTSSYTPSGGRDNQNWRKSLERVGADFIPYFNAGFMVFQNGAHSQLSPEWEELTREALNERLFSLEMLRGGRFAEQLALSAAASLAELSYEGHDESVHALASLPEEREEYDTVVYHTGGSGFHRVDPLIDKGWIRRWKNEPFSDKTAINVQCELQKVKNRVMLLLRRVYGKWVVGQQQIPPFSQTVKTVCRPWLPRSLMK